MRFYGGVAEKGKIGLLKIFSLTRYRNAQLFAVQHYCQISWLLIMVYSTDPRLYGALASVTFWRGLKCLFYNVWHQSSLWYAD